MFDLAGEESAVLEHGLEMLDRQELAAFLARCNPKQRELYRLRACEGAGWDRIAAVGDAAETDDRDRLSARLRKRYSRLVARAPRGLVRFFELAGCPCNLGERCARPGPAGRS